MKTPEIICIESKFLTPTNFYSKYRIESFPPGQSVTVANMLRRSVLSEVPGTAISLVNIPDAKHEYDTIDGIRECVLDILLNLKQVVLKSEFDIFLPQMGFINFKGPGVVRAGDLYFPMFISCVDPDQYIATLTGQGQLKLKFLIQSSKTYKKNIPDTQTFCQQCLYLDKLKPTIPLKYSALDWRRRRLAEPNYYYQQWRQHKIGLLSTLNESQKSLYWKNRWVRNQYQSKAIEYVDYSKIAKNLNKIKQKKFAKFDQYDLLDLELKKMFKLNKLDKYSLKTLFQNLFRVSYFPLTPVFAPVTRVNFTIQAHDYTTNKEDILLEIWTNGAIHPRTAIHKGIRNLFVLLLPFQMSNRCYGQLEVPSQIKKLRQKQKIRSLIKKRHFLEIIQHFFELAKKNKPVQPTERIQFLSLGSYKKTNQKQTQRQQYLCINCFLQTIQSSNDQKLVHSRIARLAQKAKSFNCFVSPITSLSSKSLENDCYVMFQSNKESTSIFNQQKANLLNKQLPRKKKNRSIYQQQQLVKLFVKKRIYSIDIASTMLNLNPESLLILKQANINNLQDLFLAISNNKLFSLPTLTEQQYKHIELTLKIFLLKLKKKLQPFVPRIQRTLAQKQGQYNTNSYEQIKQNHQASETQ